MISHGLRDKDIAAALRISEQTVYTHVKNILLKLGVKDRTAAVRMQSSAALFTCGDRRIVQRESAWSKLFR